MIIMIMIITTLINVIILIINTEMDFGSVGTFGGCAPSPHTKKLVTLVFLTALSMQAPTKCPTFEISSLCPGTCKEVF